MTTDDETWLALIAGAPGERSHRLAYATALGDDPRAELIRLEEAARTMPLTSDAYWALKPRRDELRQRTDRAWRDAMGYGTRQQMPALAPWPDDWRERWRLLREMTEQWFGVVTGDVGRTCERVDDIEATVGRELPPSVREWVVFLDDILQAGAWQYIFRDAVSLAPMPEHAAFSLMIQGEADRHWAVRYDHFHRPDPPVETYVLNLFGFTPPELPPDSQPPPGGAHEQATSSDEEDLAPSATPDEDPDDDLDDEDLDDFVDEDLDDDDGDGFCYAGRKAGRLTDWAIDFLLEYRDAFLPHPSLRSPR